MYLIIRFNHDGDTYIPYNSAAKAKERFDSITEESHFHTDSAIFLVKGTDGEEFGVDQNHFLFGGAEFIESKIFNY
jgi:hypothetical protein